MRDKSKEERLQEPNTYKLEALEMHALSDLNSGKNQVEKSRREWAAFEAVQIEQEKKLAAQTAIVHDAICKAHGIERNGRSVIVSKDLSTFTLGEADGAEAGQQKQEAKIGIVDPNGRAIDGDKPRIVAGGAPVDGKLDAQSAGDILQLVETERRARV